jgi:hypothetical protein
MIRVEGWRIEKKLFYLRKYEFSSGEEDRSQSAAISFMSQSEWAQPLEHYVNPSTVADSTAFRFRVGEERDFLIFGRKMGSNSQV